MVKVRVLVCLSALLTSNLGRSFWNDTGNELADCQSTGCCQNPEGFTKLRADRELRMLGGVTYGCVGGTFLR